MGESLNKTWLDPYREKKKKTLAFCKFIHITLNFFPKPFTIVVLTQKGNTDSTGPKKHHIQLGIH